MTVDEPMGNLPFSTGLEWKSLIRTGRVRDLSIQCEAYDNSSETKLSQMTSLHYHASQQILLRNGWNNLVGTSFRPETIVSMMAKARIRASAVTLSTTR